MRKNCFYIHIKEDSLSSIFRQNNQNMVIDGLSKESTILSRVENLAYKLMINDSLIKDYIICLRENYKSKQEDFLLLWQVKQMKKKR